MNVSGFRTAFEQLLGYPPFAWQERLYTEIAAGKRYEALDIPTGLGKTAIIAIWLIALAEQARAGTVSLPRRLVYVVDRRTVVDQSTDVAMKIRSRLESGDAPAVADGLRKLSSDPKTLIAISTLRGEYADNKEWQEDPARAAIIVGTVDMIGSRLLFSGYGVSRKMRPFHAGLLGQDTLIVHDEAHLSPAFGKLIGSIANIQRQAKELRPMEVLELSATQRAGSEGRQPFVLIDEDYDNETVKRRLDARKALHLHDLAEGAKIEDELATHALKIGATPSRVLVYVRSPDMARKVVVLIEAGGNKGNTAILTGTIRGYERDLLTTDPATITDQALKRGAEIFRGVRAAPGRTRPAAAEYLVATSAGEVGIDLDADHMVCDLTELDSMIQRLGRVNRLGEGNATIDVIVAPPPKDDAEAPDRDLRIKATRVALATLPTLADGGHDASPRALKKLADELGAESLAACFSRTPRMVDLTDVLLDGWAMTSVEKLPGSPKVERWLHGIQQAEPELHVAWREEVSELTDAEPADLRNLYETHEIRSRERVGGRRRQVLDELDAIARRIEGVQAVLIPASGEPRLVRLADLGDEDDLYEATIVLPPEAGGLDENGMLNGRVTGSVRDVADAELNPRMAGRQERMRVLLRQNPDTEMWSARPLAQTDKWDMSRLVADTVGLRAAARAAREARPMMAETGRIVLATDNLGAETKVLLLLNERGSLETAQESSAAAAKSQVLDQHNRWAGEEAGRFVQAAAIDPALGEAIVLAANNHDFGKDRGPWQADIGNPQPRRKDVQWRPLAKSGRRGFVSRLAGAYRHEFGSVRQAMTDTSIADHAESDLILHLIAAHHGWARPHFAPEHWDIDPDVTDEENAAVVEETMRRFARLQRRFGRWGLAWLESMVRASDYSASRKLETSAPEEERASPAKADA